MEIAIRIVQFICSLSLLVLIHELGHFAFARMFGMRVDKFYLFFNPWFSLFKVKVGQTEYGIGWVPFGGYVKIAGMIDESMDKEQMAQPPKPDEFRSKPAWQRLLVMLGGVLMNVVLAVCIYIGISWAWGENYIANEDVKYGWVFNELGHEIGFRDGDRILTVGGKTVDVAAAVPKEMMINAVSRVEVLRDGERVTIDIPSNRLAQMLDSPDLMMERLPFVAGRVIEGGGAAGAGVMEGDSLVAVDGQPMLYFDQYLKYIGSRAGRDIELTVARSEGGGVTERTLTVAVNGEGKIGVQPYDLSRYVPMQTRNFTLLQSIPAGIELAGSKISDYWKSLKLIFKADTKAYKSVGGPISIFYIFPGQWSWMSFWNLTAFLSIVLAVMNILPIPGLDGGHVMFVLYEIITGRKPGDKFLERAQVAGLIILLFIMVYATGNDISRHFFK